MDLFKTIFAGAFTVGQFLTVVLVSTILGLLVSFFYRYKNTYSKSLLLALTLIPSIEAVVIMMVNGSLGAGIAVAGSFSLIRFRSVKGNARDLTCIFLSMVIGIICGSGYVAIAVLFTLIILLVAFVLISIPLPKKEYTKSLKITIPESLSVEIFDEILKKYTKSHELVNVKTINLGSLFRLDYEIALKNNNEIKLMIDELRTLNSNLEISCGRITNERDEL